MKYLIIVLISYSSLAHATHVNGYVKKDGTYVNSYDRSSSDDTKTNNYSYDSSSSSDPYNHEHSRKHDDSYKSKNDGFGSNSED